MRLRYRIIFISHRLGSSKTHLVYDKAAVASAIVNRLNAATMPEIGIYLCSMEIDNAPQD